MSNQRDRDFHCKLGPDHTTQIAHARKAAELVAELLTQSLQQAEQQKRFLYMWERESVLWLREHCKLDPSAKLNLWVADRYVRNISLDLMARASSLPVPDPDPDDYYWPDAFNRVPHH